MIPIFYHLIIEIVNRFKLAINNKTNLNGIHYIEQNLGKILIKCQEIHLLSELQLNNSNSNNNSNGNNSNEINQSQKILNSFFEASIAWSLIAEITILKNSGSVTLIDIDIIRSNTFNLIEIIPTRGSIQNIIDMVTIIFFFLLIFLLIFY